MNEQALFDAARQLLGEQRVDDEQDGPTLRFEKCADCGYVRYPSAPLCPECLSSRSNTVNDNGLGSVWSYCVYHRAFDPAFKDALPYNVALVELDSGVRMISNILGVEPHELFVGMRVVARPTEIKEGRRLVYFAPDRMEELP